MVKYYYLCEELIYILVDDGAVELQTQVDTTLLSHECCSQDGGRGCNSLLVTEEARTGKAGTGTVLRNTVLSYII